MKMLFVMAIAGCAFLIASGTPAEALPPFKKAFEDKYASEKGNEKWAAEVRIVGCNVCHIKDKPKTMRNVYGEAIAELIEGSGKDRMSVARNKGAAAEKAEVQVMLKELDAAFDKLAKKKNAKGVTYGELIKAYKLPE